MSNNSSSSNGGIGFVGLLAIAFIVLKLCGVIHWSWLWVLAPLWGGLALLLVIVGLILGGAAVIGLVVAALDSRKKKRIFGSSQSRLAQARPIAADPAEPSHRYKVGSWLKKDKNSVDK